ncbi:MAG TPA: DUF2958 domain-containing protein [Candidatus Saccharimonadales bacterium]|nr:DUF2958 domain-containing protein [Candidatus Saccharimonadales bacterium]
MSTLLTKDLKRRLPGLYETELVPVAEKMALAKLFHPVSNWQWYVIEYDGQDTCFGLVVGHETECGYFSLEELSQTYGFGLPVERDRYFRPTQLQDLLIHNIERVVAV